MMAKYTHYERQGRWLAKNPNYVKNWKEKNPYYHRAYLREWSKSYKGCLSYIYSRMKRRVKSYPHYKGLPILSRQEFYNWANKDIDFMVLFRLWCFSNYDKHKTPSIDRIDSTKGYIIGNMRFITTQENRLDGCRRANKARWKK